MWQPKFDIDVIEAAVSNGRITARNIVKIVLESTGAPMEIGRLNALLESNKFVIDNQRAELIECYEEIARLRNEAKAA